MDAIRDILMRCGKCDAPIKTADGLPLIALKRGGYRVCDNCILLLDHCTDDSIEPGGGVPIEEVEPL